MKTNATQGLTIDEVRTRMALIKEAQRDAFDAELSLCVNIIATYITHPTARHRVSSALIRRMADALLLLAEDSPGPLKTIPEPRRNPD